MLLLLFTASINADGDRLLRTESLLEGLDSDRRRASASVGTYEVEECTLVERLCTDIENCAGDVTCTGPEDSQCSECEPGFTGETCTPAPPPTTTAAPPTGAYQQL